MSSNLYPPLLVLTLSTNSYGEQGAIIINHTLYDLFPPASLNADLTAPLTPTEFIQRVLVPEAAVALICRDLSVDKEAAIKTLRDSSQYGVAMFPDMDKDDVGEEIVRERARVRRQEIEDEEKDGCMLEHADAHGDSSAGEAISSSKRGKKGTGKMADFIPSRVGSEDGEKSAPSENPRKKGKGKKIGRARSKAESIAETIVLSGTFSESDVSQIGPGDSAPGSDFSPTDTKGKRKKVPTVQEKLAASSRMKDLKTPKPRPQVCALGILSSDDEETPRPKKGEWKKHEFLMKSTSHAEKEKPPKASQRRSAALAATSHPLAMVKARTSTRCVGACGRLIR